MKVGLLYPTVAGLVEKMGALFPGLTVIGPPCDDLHKWDSRILPLAKAIARQDEWREVGLDIHFEEKPYSQCDFSKFDLLIESVETFNYSADWKNHCHRVECPIIVKSCWMTEQLPEQYVESRKRFPFFLEMPSHLDNWKASKFSDVTLVNNPVGNWWFEKEWTGKKEQVLFVLAGKDLWRPADKAVCGVDLWERIEKEFPGRTYHQDGAMNFKTTRQMTELYAESRVFVNLDNGGGRPLCTSFTEALAAGMPVVARDLPGLSYKPSIENNGVCTENFDLMCAFIKTCLSDIEYAKSCGNGSRKIASHKFSVETIRPTYAMALLRAERIFQSGSF